MASNVTANRPSSGSPYYSENHGLDQATENFLKEFAKTFASIDKLPIPEQRTTIKSMFQVPESQLEPVAKIESKIVMGRHGPIPIRIFSPTLEKDLPVIVFFHRGGWVYGSLDESEMICRRLSHAAGAIIAAVEYRLAPEHKFPVPLDDCYDAAKWIAEHAYSFSGNPKKIILCGESAGGNLAAAVALLNRTNKKFSVAGQILIYPVLTSDLEEDHYKHSPDKYLLSLENMKFFLESYLNTQNDYQNPHAAPLKSKDFSGLPQCFIVTAEHDALKHEGASYGKALQSAGVRTERKCYPGVIHGFLDLPLADDVKKEAFADIGTWMKNI